MADENIESGFPFKAKNVGFHSEQFKKQDETENKNLQYDGTDQAEMQMIKHICATPFLANNKELLNVLAIHCTFDIFLAAGDAQYGDTCIRKWKSEDKWKEFEKSIKSRVSIYYKQFNEKEKEMGETFAASLYDLHSQLRNYEYYTEYMPHMIGYRLFGKRFKIDSIRLAGIHPLFKNKSNNNEEEERIRYIHKYVEQKCGNDMAEMALLLGTGLGHIYKQAKISEEERKYGGWQLSKSLADKMVYVRTRKAKEEHNFIETGSKLVDWINSKMLYVRTHKANEDCNFIDAASTLEEIYWIKSAGLSSCYGIIFTKDSNISENLSINNVTYFQIDHGMPSERIMRKINLFNKCSDKTAILLFEGKGYGFEDKTIATAILKHIDPDQIKYVLMDDYPDLQSNVMDWAKQRSNINHEPIYLDLALNTVEDTIPKFGTFNKSPPNYLKDIIEAIPINTPRHGPTADKKNLTIN